MQTHRQRTRRRPAASRARSTAQGTKAAAPDSTLVTLARQLRGWSDSALGLAEAAADVSIGAAKAVLVKPEQRRALGRAGALLRGMREAAGMSVREVGAAIDLSDPALLELVESGKVALPFEIVLRLASVLGRNDPIAFVMRFTRSYQPEIWRTLEHLGVGRLAVQAGRERELANVYRASDAARRLSDEDFAAVLAFTRQAFEMAVGFRAATPPRTQAKRRTAK
ncbi:MAG: helix-turn-helix domain-containing protein [Rudaea sp.]